MGRDQAPDAETAPADPGSLLRLIQTEQRQARHRLYVNPLSVHVPWGLAWLIGYGLIFLRYGPDGRVMLDTPRVLPWLVLILCCAAALTATIIGIRRGTRHISGQSSHQSMMYGLAWCFGLLSVTAVAARLDEMLDLSHRILMWSSLTTAVVGMLYIAGAAIWHSWYLFGCGLWIVVANSAGLVAGPGWHALVTALAGGGGLIVFGVLLRLRGGRAGR
ncbi:hypothetical protein AB0O28_23940 [Microbispora sp. NPDC088329]|uniref:hypothetical protein n=1 Tax=unclassified Microbispora TaxID=2614687 RepID=UPI003437EF57